MSPVLRWFPLNDCGVLPCINTDPSLPHQAWETDVQEIQGSEATKGALVAAPPQTTKRVSTLVLPR